jgi:hypothetical protein
MQLYPGHILSFIPGAWAHKPGTINGDEFFVSCDKVVSEVNQKKHHKILILPLMSKLRTSTPPGPPCCTVSGVGELSTL